MVTVIVKIIKKNNTKINNKTRKKKLIRKTKTKKKSYRPMVRVRGDSVRKKNLIKIINQKNQENKKVYKK